MRNQALSCLLVALGLLGSCGSKSGLAGRVEAEVNGKYLKAFNDPATYEAVENKYDSVGYPAYRQSLLAGIRQNDQAIKENTAAIAKSEKSAKDIGYYGLVYGMAAAQQLYSEIQQSKAKSLEACNEARKYRAGFVGDTVALARLGLTRKDVYVVHVKHIYRAKNPAGALQRGAFDFDYYPKRDSLVMVANNPAYPEGLTSK